MVIASHMGLFKLKQLKRNESFSLLATSQVLVGHVWLVATILDTTDGDHYHPHRKLCWRHCLGVVFSHCISPLTRLVCVLLFKVLSRLSVCAMLIVNDSRSAISQAGNC